MGTMICKVVCDDPIRQKLKAASVYSEASEFGAQYRAQTVRRATYSSSTSIQYVGIDHRSTDIPVNAHKKPTTPPIKAVVTIAISVSGSWFQLGKPDQENERSDGHD